MNNEEMIELANDVKEAVIAIKERNKKLDNNELKEVGEFIIPAIFMLTEVFCDIKRIANSLDQSKPKTDLTNGLKVAIEIIRTGKLYDVQPGMNDRELSDNEIRQRFITLIERSVNGQEANAN